VQAKALAPPTYYRNFRDLIQRPVFSDSFKLSLAFQDFLSNL
jgi:hypothetical protein